MKTWNCFSQIRSRGIWCGVTLEIDFVEGNTVQIESALPHSELDIALVPLKRPVSAKLLADFPFLL